MGFSINLSVLIGALIAGLVGLIASLVSSWYGDLLNRRREHLQRHKENLELIKEVCYDVLKDAFPPWKLGGLESFGTPWLGKYGMPAEEDRKVKIESELAKLAVFDVTKYLLSYTRDDGSTVLTSAKVILRSDLKNHFKDLSDSIDGYEILIRTKGFNLLNDYYIFSDKIYDDLAKVGYTSRNALKAGPTPPLYIEDAARIVFNLTLDFEISKWPNTYRFYNSIPTERDKLLTLAGKLKRSQIATEIREGMSKLEGAKESLDMKLEEANEKTRLSGSCRDL